MESITVLIPAFNRPELLRVALQSVARQTAKSNIDKIIVSENGLNPDSKLICDEFSNLPILYILQQPQLPVLSHLKWLMSQEQHGYVAMLCDDDWWHPIHLELAIRSLKQEPRCIAYFSNFIYAEEENNLKLQVYQGLKALHLGRSDFSSANLINYNQEDILMLAALVTPFHFSAMICEGKALSQAVEIFDSIHPTYADRILWATLSLYGNLLFNPLSTTVVRMHEEMDSRRYSSIEWRQQAQEGSLQVLNLAKSKGYDVKERINIIYANLSPSDSTFLVDQLDSIFLDKDNLQWFAGYNIIIERARQAEAQRRSIRAMAGRMARRIINSF